MELAERNQGDYCADLHTWIDTISCTKPKKNLTRDFSDAVLMAEILKAYYPRYVDLHNYIPASGVQMKRDNWQTLNRKVLSKIDMRLSNEMIDQLANAHQGVIERLLTELRARLSKNEPSLCEQSGPIAPDHIATTVVKARDHFGASEELASIGGEMTSVSATWSSRLVVWGNSIAVAFKWILSWLFVWNPLPVGRSKGTDTPSRRQGGFGEQRTNRPSGLPEDNLREKLLVVSALGEKVASLEKEVKQQERHISKLAARFVEKSGQAEKDQCPKQRNFAAAVAPSSSSKVRGRPLNVPEPKIN